jgi:hypothetical protein
MRASWASIGGALAVLVALLAGASVAHADPDPDVARLSDGHSRKTNWVPPGAADRYGRAEVLVHAPLAAVKARVLDFASYKDFSPDRFHNVHVIGKTAGGTDVYMQLPIMNGVVTLWQVMRFRDVAPLAPGWAIVEGFYEKGNLKRGNATWTLRRVDDTTTLLQFDLLIVPLVPAPQSLVDEELRDAAMQAVDAIRDHAQAAPGPVPYAGP